MKLWNLFLNFTKFDCCLHSLSIFIGGGYYKYEIKSKFRVWVCRFGNTSCFRSDNNVGIGKKVCTITCQACEESCYEFGNNGAQHDLDFDQ
jgi:hypothetical protein